MKKKSLNLSISEDLIRKAREYNINFSSFLEIRLREYLALIVGKEHVVTPFNDNQKSRINNSQDTPANSKSNNTFSDNETNLRARGVVWHPSTLGW